MFQNFELLDLRTQIPVTQVQYIPNFLHQHEMSAIKELAKNLEIQDGAILGGGVGLNVVHRMSQIRWISWNDDNWWLYIKIMQKAKELNDTIWRFDLYGINEYLQYTEYQNLNGNRGHFDWHMDVAHEGITSNRKLTFECIVDDQYEGGEFSILLGPSEHKVKLRKGDAVVFPSFLLNKVYPVNAGNRTSIVSWIAGPSFK